MVEYLRVFLHAGFFRFSLARDGCDHQVGIRIAEDFDDVDLKVNLENQVPDETLYKEELERIIADWR